MIEKTAEGDRFNWRPPLYAAVGALVIFLSMTVYSSQWGTILYLLGVVPIISLVLLIIGIVLALGRKPRRALGIVATLLVFWAVSWVLWRNQLNTRSEVRWLFESKAYKSQALAEPIPANGELRHIEWDGWGFPGAGDTTVYLVFAPNDSLARPARSHAPGKFIGLPCEVAEIHRLEKDWYTVFFYTDTAWGHCY
jgi:hypothetical protein